MSGIDRASHDARVALLAGVTQDGSWRRPTWALKAQYSVPTTVDGRRYAPRMKAAVAPTDDRWAEFLAERLCQAEANFWKPTPTGRFRMLQTGEPFLFKTKSPKPGRVFTRWGPNQLVGGGFFSGYAQLSIAEAWDLFGEGNGVTSLPELVSSIGAYARGATERSVIGCVLLRDLFFMPPGDALPQPADFAGNLTQARGYDLEGAGRHVDLVFADMLGRAETRVGDDVAAMAERADPVRFRERLVRARLGQQAFQGMVLTFYGRRCAVTGNHIVPTLEAAHIRPVTQGGVYRVDNGLLLRSDVHTLFDRGYLGVNERFELQVSSALREEWGNGREFYAMAGERIRVPALGRDRPSRESVTWHMDQVFRR